MGPVRWTDDHCHLPDEGWQQIVADARAAGVERFIDVGCDVADSAAAIARAEASDAIWATAGIHPHEAKHVVDGLGLDGLVDLLDHPRVVAVGECGFDFHYSHSPADAQRDVFAAQIALANERDLALVIHTREAWDETFEVLDAEGVPDRTVFHCFSGGPDDATECLSRGAYLSFSGIVSFPSATELQAAAARCPLDRLLVETDSPYLAPVPHRGTRNQPAWLVDVGAAVAAAAGHDVAAVASATWDNATRVYRLDAPEARR